MLNAEISNDDRTCLDDFLHLRQSLMSETGTGSYGKEDDPPHYRGVPGEDVGTHELLIAEVLLSLIPFLKQIVNHFVSVI